MNQNGENEKEKRASPQKAESTSHRTEKEKTAKHDGAPKEHPAKYAFLTTPVASATDRTGYGIRMPMDEEEAEELSDMFDEVPTTPSRLGKHFRP